MKFRGLIFPLIILVFLTDSRAYISLAERSNAKVEIAQAACECPTKDGCIICPP